MFTGFTASDFAAYARVKWRSNAFTRERLEVKEKLVALGRLLAGGLVSADGSPLACEASVEYPALFNQKQVDAQHLFFSRHEQARKRLDRIIERQRTLASMLEDPSPQRSHIVLVVSVDETQLFAGLKLHRDASVDRRNLEAMAGDEHAGAALVDQLRALPADVRFGVTGAPLAEPGAIDSATVAAALEALSAPAAPGTSRWLVVGRTMTRDDALSSGQAIADWVRAGLLAVLPVYQRIEWTAENDHIAMRDELQKQRVAQRVRGIEENDEVRITSGLFSGRTGTVQHVDAKGGVKVLVGNVPLKLSSANVEKL